MMIYKVMLVVGFLLLLAGIGSYALPLIGIELPSIAPLLSGSGYVKSLIGGLMFGYCKARLAATPAANTKATTSRLAADSIVCPNPKCARPLNSGLRYCTSCGTPIPRSAAPNKGCSNPACDAEKTAGLPFCRACGWPVEGEQETREPSPKNLLRCPNRECGEIVQAEQKFCTACGTPLK